MEKEKRENDEKWWKSVKKMRENGREKGRQKGQKANEEKEAGIKAEKWQFDKHTETMSNEKSEKKNHIGF